MKLLVTGGAGFIGSNFILYWLAKYPKDTIVNIDSLTYAGNLENLKSVEKNPNYSFVLGDITDSDAVSEAMEGVDIVVHFAAESHVDRSIIEAEQFVFSNVVGTYVLLESARKKDIKRFHHISTDEVFGSIEKGKFNEFSRYDPRSPYSASKAGSDHLVKAYFYTHGLPITITNCSNNFGQYQFPEKLIALAITNLLEGKKIPVYGDGLYIRDWLHVEDHCRAIDLVINQGKIGESYCIGGLTQDTTNLDVIKKILKIFGKDESSIEYVKDRPGHDRRYAVDWTKIKTELNWQPQYDFDTWLEKTINWYKSNESWWKNVKSGDYQKYYAKQYQSDSNLENLTTESKKSKIPSGLIIENSAKPVDPLEDTTQETYLIPTPKEPVKK